MSDATITLPEWLLASARKHNELVRAAVRAECEHHVRVRLPGHFTQGAAAKYGHRKRTRKYILYKVRKYHTGTDLVKTGRSRTEVPAMAKITVSGSASEGTIRGRIVTRFPFGGGTGMEKDEATRRRLGLGPPSRIRTDGITPAEMRKEVERVIPLEGRESSQRIRAHYIASIRAMRRPRLIAGAVLPELS